MWKLALIMVAGLLCMLWFMLAPVSETYWESIGPAWDQMLNPNKYSNEE